MYSNTNFKKKKHYSIPKFKDFYNVAVGTTYNKKIDLKYYIQKLESKKAVTTNFLTRVTLKVKYIHICMCACA